MTENYVKYEQERVGDFIQLYSGKFFYPQDPRPEDVTIVDVAHSLSNLPRYTGHSERFYSVGEHSLRCATLADSLGLSSKMILYALLHDASECIVNDVARPIKQYLPEYKAIEDKVMKVMWESFELPEPTKEEYNVIKKLDNTLLIHEISQIMKRSSYEAKVEVFDVTDESVLESTLNFTFYPESNKETKDSFLYMYHQLKLKLLLERKL